MTGFHPLAPLPAGLAVALFAKSARQIILIPLTFISAYSVFVAPEAGAVEQLVEGIAAQVGSELVLASEVMELAGPVEERLKKAGAPASEIVTIRKEALERLIETRLVSSVVERLELAASRDEIDSAIAAIAADNELSVDQLLRSITQHGLSEEEYRAKIKGEIERSKVINAMVRSRVQITEDEIQSLYEEQFGSQRSGGEEIYLRHILVTAKDASSNTAACGIVSAARNQIASGESKFEDVASRVSELNPERGGDVGWMHREDLATWMSDTIAKMKPGELSRVIDMPFGCNLLQVVERRPFERIEYEAAKSQLQNVVYQRKTEIEYTKWLDVLREQTYIERKAGFGG